MMNTEELSTFWDRDCPDPDCICHRNFEPEFVLKLDSAFRFLYSEYFRCELIGVENIPVRPPGTPPLIYAANHSGMSFPWDIMMVEYGLWDLYRSRGARPADKVRSLSAPLLSHMPYMAPYWLEDFWRKAGAIDATYDNFDTMMRHRWDVFICPEGVPGIGKGFNRRYQLQRFSSSFVRMAVKYHTPIIPITVVNAEYIDPYAYSFKPLNRLANRLRIPFFPVSVLAVGAVTVPWMFYMALPVKLVVVFGKPIVLSEDPATLADDDYRRLTDGVQGIVQGQLNRAVAEYGRHPYELSSFLSSIAHNWKDLAHLLPVGWPDMFLKTWNKHLAASRGKKYTPFTHYRQVAPFLLPGIGWPLLAAQNAWSLLEGVLEDWANREE
jgi:1-acyl-sn-glycerol-3-phosphate acyltransferase